MAQKPQIIDITRSYLPGDPNVFPKNLVSTDKEDGEERTIPVMPYEGYNFLPTSYGYRSYFGTKAILTAIALITSKVDKVICYQLNTYVNKLIALCSDGIWIYDAVGTTWTKVQALTDNSGSSQYDEWTYCVIENVLYLYRQGNSVVYKYSFAGALTNFAPTFLNMTGQMGIFRARGRLGFWDSANSISWSSSSDLTDFTPSLENLAGNTIFSAVVGRIVSIRSQGDGFIIYSTKSLVGVAYDVNGSQIWTAQSIKDSTGVATSNDITQGKDSEEHFVRTNTGFYSIEAYNPVSNKRTITPILTDLWDIMKENNYPMKLDCFDDRFLFISTLDDTYINAKTHIISQTVPDYTQHLLNFTLGVSVLPSVLTAGQIASYLALLFAGPTASRHGVRYSVYRWTGVLATVPTDFYCNWDSSIAAGRKAWNDLSVFKAYVKVLPNDETTISSMASAALTYNGVPGLSGTKTIAGIRPNEKYSDTAEDDVLGKVYVDTLHYTQESIWDNVKERNLAIVKEVLAYPFIEKKETYTNTVSTPEIPLNDTTTNFGILADGYGATSVEVSADNNEIILRKFFQSGYQLSQYITQEDIVTPESGGGAFSKINESLNPFSSTMSYILYLGESATDVSMYMIAQSDFTAGFIFYNKATNTITTYEANALFTWYDTGNYVIYNNKIHFWIGSDDEYYEKWNNIGSIQETASTITPYNALVYNIVKVIADNGACHKYLTNSATAITHFYYTSGYESSVSENITIAQLSYRWLKGFETPTKLISVSYDKVTSIRIIYCIKATSYTAWSTVNVTPAIPCAFLVVYGVDGEYLYIGNKASGGADTLIYKVSITTGVATLLYTIPFSISIVADSYTIRNDVIYALKIPAAGPNLEIYRVGSSNYEHKRTTRYYPRSTTVSNNTAHSDFKLTKTHIDYCYKRKNGSVTVEHSTPITVTPNPAWDSMYPLGIENGKDVWIIDAAKGPNPVDLYKGLYGGVSLPNAYFSPIDSNNSSYSYYTSFQLNLDLSITYPGATFILQNGVPAPLYPTYKGAFVFDLQLKKWGKLKADYKALLNVSPINTTSQGIINYTNFGLMSGIINADNSVALFDAAPDDSFIRYGKIGYTRLGMSSGYEVHMFFRNIPDCEVVVEASLDGLGLEPILEYTEILDSASNAILFDLQGRYHTISLYGKFDLQYLEFRGIISTRR